MTIPETTPPDGVPAPIAAEKLRVRILRYGQIEWRRCKWLQPEQLKKQSPAQKAKLKKSIHASGFAAPFFVWDCNGTTYILDGHHRQPALRELEKEGIAVPDVLPACWIDARDEQEARKFVLIYSSRYFEFDQDGLFAFLSDFDPAEILTEIEIPGVKLDLPSEAEEDEEPEGEFPIIAEFSESYNGVIIFCTNDIDWNNLCERLGLETVQSYKSSAVGTARAIPYAQFAARIGEVPS